MSPSTHANTLDERTQKTQHACHIGSIPNTHARKTRILSSGICLTVVWKLMPKPAQHWILPINHSGSAGVRRATAMSAHGRKHASPTRPHASASRFNCAARTTLINRITHQCCAHHKRDTLHTRHSQSIDNFLRQSLTYRHTHVHTRTHTFLRTRASTQNNSRGRARLHLGSISEPCSGRVMSCQCSEPITSKPVHATLRSWFTGPLGES